MLYRAYCFPSAEAADAAAEGVSAIAIDVIGVVHAPPVAEHDPPQALPGWHVNAVWVEAEPDAWASARIAPADAPRWWSGVPRTEPTPEPPPVPREVTNYQARAVMRATLLPDGRSLETAVREALAGARDAAAALPEADPVRIAADQRWLAWEQSNNFYRDSALVLAFAAALGLSDADVDALFRAAAEVVA
jgi:hypothetical protein